MNHPFEKWISSTHLPDSSQTLLLESLQCYKASAYRAALLIGYLGFLALLRHRVLSATAPSQIPAKQWSTLQATLRDDELWEPNLNGEIQRAEKNIFGLNEDQRQQITYWRNRRNDCAHARATRIEASHVEMFYVFVRDNFEKIVVSGGLDSLLNDFAERFDPVLSRYSTDFTLLVGRIPYAVHSREREVFFERIDSLIEVKGYVTEKLMNQHISLLAQLATASDDQTARNGATLLIEGTNSQKYLIRTLERESRILNALSDNPKLIRLLWKVKLWREPEGASVFKSMFLMGLIPVEDNPDLMETLLEIGDSSVSAFEDFGKLNEAGFFQSLEKYAFVSRKLLDKSWLDRASTIFTIYLEHRAISAELAKSLQPIVISRSRFYNATFTEHFAKFLYHNDGKYKEYELALAAARLGLSIDLQDAIEYERRLADEEIPF